MRFGREYEAKTGRKYIKSDKKLYDIMYDKGNEENAIKITKYRYEDFKNQKIEKPSEMLSCSTVFQLVQEIREKVNK